MTENRDAVATGGCQCGAIRYALYVAPQNAHVCHCRMCQRATGGLFAALAGAPKPDFAWTKGEPAYFASSNLATRPFCRDCGTPLGFTYAKPDAKMYVTIGSLDDPAAAPVEVQFGVESRLPWVTFGEGLKEETTGGWSDEATAFFAGMTNNQA
jgi:hypothetical protein